MNTISRSYTVLKAFNGANPPLIKQTLKNKLLEVHVSNFKEGSHIRVKLDL